MSVQWFSRAALDQAIDDCIQRTEVVLDIGCGIRPQAFFEPKLHICCEPHTEYALILQNRFASYPNVLVLQGTWHEVVALLPDGSVDSVFILDVIEHLEKEEGRCLIRECERIARKQILIFTPLGLMPQEYKPGDRDGWGLSGTDWQVHKSGWTPDDFDDSWEILGAKEYHFVDAQGEELDHPFGALWVIKNIPQIHFPIKFAILSHILPPSPSGQAMVLYRLLRGLDPAAYCLISRQDYNAYFGPQDADSRLPARYYHVPSRWRLPMLKLPIVRTMRALANSLVQLVQRAVEVIRIIQIEECSAIIACTADSFDLPAAYLASWWTGIPFYTYIFDDYVYQWPTPERRFFAKLVAPIVMRSAAGVIVPNEFLCDEYRCRYRIEPIVIHNPCDSLQCQGETPWPADRDEIKLVYTGAIYGVHLDAFRNLLDAIKLLGRDDLRLHLYTDQTMAELEQWHIVGPIIHHQHVPRSVALEVQCRADILFLPLAFNSAGSEVVRTAAPGKMGEYLASGRPVLAHVPQDSYVSWYFREYGVGCLVDRPDPQALAQAIQQILDEPELRLQWCKNALMRARADFSVETSRAKFLELLKAGEQETMG